MPMSRIVPIQYSETHENWPSGGGNLIGTGLHDDPHIPNPTFGGVSDHRLLRSFDHFRGFVTPLGLQGEGEPFKEGEGIKVMPKPIPILDDWFWSFEGQNDRKSIIFDLIFDEKMSNSNQISL